MQNLNSIISNLINSKKEGDYWDFKLVHHENPVDLVNDIICLANNVRCKGDRYLIFGVHPTSFEVVGIENSVCRRNQAQIIDILRSVNFASGQFPDIRLDTIELYNKKLDILIIIDRAEKPYYLETDYTKQGKTVRAGVVYSRIVDTNTPTDKCSSVTDIEKMWKERFGLDQTPLERLKKYLSDFDSWENIEENTWYYKQFPEFTICPTNDEVWAVEAGDSWVRVAPNPKAFVRPMVAKFHQTILFKIVCIYFDEMRGLIPAPQATFLPNDYDKFFYSFCVDDFSFCFLEFFCRRNKYHILNDGVYGGRSRFLPILVFSSESEKANFLDYIKKNTVEVLPRHQLLKADKFSRISENDAEVVAYCRAVIEAFSEWNNG